MKFLFRNIFHLFFGLFFFFSMDFFWMFLTNVTEKMNSKEMHVHFATHDKNLKVIAFQTWALKHLSQTKHKCIILKKTLFKIKIQCCQLSEFFTAQKFDWPTFESLSNTQRLLPFAHDLEKWWWLQVMWLN